MPNGRRWVEQTGRQKVGGTLARSIARTDEEIGLRLGEVEQTNQLAPQIAAVEGSW
jgi:hypothetical protein